MAVIFFITFLFYNKSVTGSIRNRAFLHSGIQMTGSFSSRLLRYQLKWLSSVTILNDGNS